MLLRQCVWRFWFCSKVDVRASKKIALLPNQEKKRHKELAVIKRQLAKKQAVKSEDLYKEYHYKQIYKKINIDMESFFYKRQYNTQNFNFLINLISQQQPPNYEERINDVLKKMSILGIQPDPKTYVYLVKTAGRAKDIELAQKYVSESSKRKTILMVVFLPDKYLYTSLIQAYVWNNNPYMALKIMEEMEEKGIVPEIATYTTVINSFRLGRKLQKCWEINRKILNKGLQLDETYVGVMMKTYAATHDAQKSIKLYRQNITEKGIKPAIETTNAYLKALSSRREYASTAIDKFFTLLENGQIVNSQTASWALRACSKTGNIRSAVQIIKAMKIKDLQVTKLSFNSLLRVYSKACTIPGLEEEYREAIIADSWKLLQELKKKNEIDTTILNNLLQVYAKSLNVEDIDGMVLPLYQKFNLPYNVYTFEILLQMYFQIKDQNQFMRVWYHLQDEIQANKKGVVQKYGEHGNKHLLIEKLNENLRPSFKSMHCYLEVGIRMMDMRMVLDGLNMFKEIKRMPKNETLKFLGELKDLPEEIRVSLMDFKIKFGSARISNKKPPLIKDPQNI